MKKGMTLIEVVVSISLILMLTVLLGDFFIRENRNYNFFKRKHREEITLKESLEFMKQEISTEMKSLKINSNSIIMGCKDNKVKIIEKQSKRLVIITQNTYGEKGVNTILKNVEYFKVLRKRENLYISVGLIGGEKLERCIQI